MQKKPCHFKTKSWLCNSEALIRNWVIFISCVRWKYRSTCGPRECNSCSEEAKIQGKTAELQSLQLGFLTLESNNPTVYRLLSILILYLGIAPDLLDSCLTAQYLTMDWNNFGQTVYNLIPHILLSTPGRYRLCQDNRHLSDEAPHLERSLYSSAPDIARLLSGRESAQYYWSHTWSGSQLLSTYGEEDLVPPKKLHKFPLQSQSIVPMWAQWRLNCTHQMHEDRNSDFACAFCRSV